jgi:hypothetical protein
MAMSWAGHVADLLMRLGVWLGLTLSWAVLGMGLCWFGHGAGLGMRLVLEGVGSPGHGDGLCCAWGWVGNWAGHEAVLG